MEIALPNGPLFWEKPCSVFREAAIAHAKKGLLETQRWICDLALFSVLYLSAVCHLCFHRLLANSMCVYVILHMICKIIYVVYVYHTFRKWEQGRQWSSKWIVEYSRVCQRTVITQKDATDMGLHTNDFPMDRISGLTTLKNCITLQGALAN